MYTNQNMDKTTRDIFQGIIFTSKRIGLSQAMIHALFLLSLPHCRQRRITYRLFVCLFLSQRNAKTTPTGEISILIV